MINEDVKSRFDEIRNLPKDKALESYYSEILPKVIESFESRNKPIDILIATTGLSPGPILLSIKYFRPKKVYLLATRKSEEETVNSIREYSSRLLNFSNINVITLNENDLLNGIFEQLKRIYQIHREEEIVIDLTGGKKLMSAAAAIAAHYLKIKCSYVNGEFSQDIRVTKPGSERILEINIPLGTYVSLWIDEWIQKINKYRFIEVYDSIRKIEEEAKEEISHELKILLTEIMDKLLKSKPLGCINKLHDNITILDKKVTLGKIIKKLKKLSKTPTENKEEFYGYKILQDLFITKYLFMNGNYIMCLIYLQKNIETIKNYLLLRKGYDPKNFKVENKDFWLEFKERFESIYKNEKYNGDISNHPIKIALKNGLVILDLIYKNENPLDIDLIQSLMKRRNDIVHGYMPKERVNIKDKELIKYFQHTIEVYNRLFNEDLSMEDFDELLKNNSHET